MPVRGLAPLVALIFAVSAPLAARAGEVVISQVFAASSGTAAFNRDFIELKNRSDAPVNLAGWWIHQGSPTGQTWNRTNLPSVILQPGQHLLIAVGTTSSGGTPLPAYDKLWNLITLDHVGARLAITRDATVFAIGCPLGMSSVVDLVGYGTAFCAQTLPAPAPTSTQGLVRLLDGCADTQDNSADLVLGTPQPHNMSAPASPCTPATCTLTVQFEGHGAGEVVSEPAGVACSSGCETVFAAGTTVVLGANPDSTSRLAGWSGAGDGFASRTLTLTAGATVVVHWACMADLTSVGGPPEGPDGQVTLDDILAFINSLGEGCESALTPCALADITGVGGPPLPADGQLTLDDLLAFVNAIPEACPP